MFIELGLVTLLSISIITWNSFYVEGTQVESPKCGGCDSIQSQCPGVATSGIFCDNATDREKIKPNKAAKEGTLAACVPEDYEVTGDIWDWCCFWNPKMGCQQLTGHYYQQHEDWNDTCELCLHSCDCPSRTHEVRSCLARVLLLCCTIIGIYSKI